MDRITQWVSSQDVPPDLTIRIADSIFPLHKAVMLPRCGYIRRAVAAATRDPSAAVELDLSALPGGADAFEKAARYCYSANFEKAAAFLDMQHPADLARRVDEFLAQAALRALPSAVAVLHSCEALLPAAEELGVVRRAADAVALRICNEALFSTRTPPGWWTAELAALSPASFKKVATALRCRRADPGVLANAASAYAELALAVVLADPRDREDQRALLESVVDVLPSASDAPIPAAFLCGLLHAAVTTEASAAPPRRGGVGKRAEPEGASLSGRAESDRGAMEKVARTVDELEAELATEESLAISKFVGVAGAVPKEARASHDSVYRAVDIYLKTHPALDEIEREKVCSVMDPLKLSYQARLHASQNKRLPLQAVLSALYYDQLKLRSGADDGWDTQTAAGKARAQARADASLARENEALRSEQARMRAYVSGMQPSKGSGSSRSAPAAKKASFLGSVSRTLSRLNPFEGGWAKDTASIADGGRHTMAHGVKPKRRFSIS
ncbi:unnamed protein product [Miscanthus lutarioriparius]|uniref:NPH3 domain-containing protein n=1 Tax=Miscanthus lutarioriparius TaxID=422564 RepID=A0A811R223_9POAL|nr:unnamed protein product [Miscanthus lutarioriparius]